MPKAHPLYLEIAAQLRALAGEDYTLSMGSYVDPQTGLTHAEQEMIDAQLDYADLVYTLQNGKITDRDGWPNEARFHVEAIHDGVHCVFIVEFSVEEHYIEIITAFRGSE